MDLRVLPEYYWLARKRTVLHPQPHAMYHRLLHTTRLIVPGIIFSTVLQSPWTVEAAPSKSAKLDAEAIARAIGKAGKWHGDVYKINLPRTDLQVSIQNVRIPPRLALESLLAFMAAGTRAVTLGNLVLTEPEVEPVVSRLEQGGVIVTAVHNHLPGATPPLMYVHFWGQGDAVELALSLKSALSQVRVPIAEPLPGETTTESEALANRIRRALGLKGEFSDGVLTVTIPRAETTAMRGIPLPVAMGIATVLNFQDAPPDKVAAAGDFIVSDEEVSPVARVLRENGIQITALHKHFLDSSPALYFIHFWTVNSLERVTKGLNGALSILER